MIKRIFFHIKQFIDYTFYLGVKIRRLQKWWKSNEEQLEINLCIWISVLSGIVALATNVLIFTKEDIYAQSDFEFDITFFIPFSIIFSAYYFRYIWNKQWIEIIEKFDNENIRYIRAYFSIFIFLTCVMLVVIYLNW